MRKLRRFLCGRMFLFAVCALLLLGAGTLLVLCLPRALAPIAAAERIFSLAIAVAVAGGREANEFRLSKLALLVALPYLGAILCLLLLPRAPAMGKNEGGMSETEGFQTENGAGMSEDALMRRAQALSLSVCGMGACCAETFEYFPVGRDMYEALISDLKGAKMRIWLEYYIVAEGKFFFEVCEILKRKAKEGVDVRLVFDGFGSALTLPHGFLKRIQQAGVRAMCFRPLRFPTRRSGRRDHRKIAVVDDVAYTGGINLADEYIGETIVHGHWKDTALRMTGGAAEFFARLFLRRWGEEALQKDTSGTFPCAVFFDESDEGERAGGRIFSMLAHGAKRSLYWNTPYLAPNEELFGALSDAALSGADVRLMIPHIPDKKLPFALTRFYARELARMGVQVREYTDGFLHAKSAVCDGEYAFVGSYNLDFRSLYLQAECGILTKCKPLAREMEKDFLSAWERGTPLPPPRPFERPFKGILRLLAPLM